VSQLPTALRFVAYATPLWHGVDMCRSLALGTATPGRVAMNVAYLAIFVAVGYAAAHRSYTRRLAT
jgi:lipooligosaccharide transport system permease protein